jgi:acetylornithine deacetylase
MENVSELLKELINTNSTTGNEGEVGNFIANLLEKEGFIVEKQQVEDNRFNIITTLSEKPKVFLQAHLDTVTPHIEASEDEENIYGRGACDTKASIACMISAAIQSKNNELNNFGLIFTVGEEVDFIGVKKILSSGLEIPFVIVGEPSSLEIVNEHFGILVIKVKAHGKSAHSSKPEEGVNAIDLLLEVVEKIKKIEVHPNTLMSLVMINGGTADNIIPGQAEAIFSFRTAPNDKNDYVEIFKSFASGSITVESELSLSSVKTEVPTELDFIPTRKTVKYSTELSFFQKGVVIGPGDIKFAHGPNEQVSKKELGEAVEIYLKIISNFSIQQST